MTGFTAFVRSASCRTAVLLAALFLLLAPTLAACGSGGQEQAARDEFKAYWADMFRVVTKQNAQTDKVHKKADKTHGAVNAFGVLCAGLGKSYGRAGDGYAAIEPPAALAAVHKDLVQATRRAGRVTARTGKEVNREIHDSDLSEFDKSWLNKQTKPTMRALNRQVKAFDAWYAAAVAEGKRLGLTFTDK